MTAIIPHGIDPNQATGRNIASGRGDDALSEILGRPTPTQHDAVQLPIKKPDLLQSEGGDLRHDRLDAVQYLRALAAVTVMLSHAMGDMKQHGGPDLFKYWYVGAAGVDLFFIISGFVMVYAARDLFGVPDAWAGFVRKRVARVVPLYWLATLVYVLLMIVRGKWSVVRPDLVVTSLVFWPYADADGPHLPVYSIGWTLDFEMFFYAIFAASLMCRRRVGLSLVTGTLLALVLLGAAVRLPEPLGFWSNPVLIDFLLGIGAGCLYLWKWRVPRRVAPLLWPAGLALFIVGALAGLNFGPGVPERIPRWAAWGLPSALVFAGSVLRNEAPLNERRRFAFLGDCSYAIYLLHPLVIIGTRSLLPWLTATMHGLPVCDVCAGIAYLLCVCALVIFGSVMVHVGLERPLTQLLSGGRRVRRGEECAPEPQGNRVKERVTTR